MHAEWFSTRRNYKITRGQYYYQECWEVVVLIKYSLLIHHSLSCTKHFSPDQRVFIFYLSWLHDALHDLEGVEGPGNALIWSHHCNQVSNTKDRHHNYQRLQSFISISIFYQLIFYLCSLPVFPIMIHHSFLSEFRNHNLQHKTESKWGLIKLMANTSPADTAASLDSI